MLTPIDIQSKEFKGALGYSKKDVDAFMAEMTESYEHLYKENIDLHDKVKNLSIALSQYKTTEKSLQKALILAESAADEVRAAATGSAKLIEDEARVKAKEIIDEAKKELEDIRSKTLEAADRLEKYKAQCKQLAKSQLELLDDDTFAVDIKKSDSYIPVQEDDAPDAKSKDAKPKDDEAILNTINAEETVKDNDDDFHEEFHRLIAEMMEDIKND